MTDAELGLGLVVDDRPGPPPGLTSTEWVRANLFNSWFNSILTVLLGAVSAVLAFWVIRWVTVTAEWEPVQRNLTLFMQGQFDRDEQWRLVTSTIILGMLCGVAAGTLSATGRDRAAETGEPWERARPADVLRRFWPVEMLVVVLLVAARTPGPWVFVGAVLAAGVVGYVLMRPLAASLRMASWGFVGLLGFASFQVISGTHGTAFLGPGAILAYGAFSQAERIIPAGRSRTVLGAGFGLVALGLTWAFYQMPLMDFGGVGWSQWSGLHLTMFTTAIALALAFPIGLLMALGRRSSFPAFRLLTVAYIEFIRGVPLITVLLTAQFFIGFFISASSNLDLITRALIGLVLFTAAYIAEIVRGGLQSVSRGQIEAGQALGLSAPRITRLIVLPQALRAVIPALVGQFISLFKDTSLLAIIGLTDFLRVRVLVHTQNDFRVGFQESTLMFIAVGYWALSYTMSRESRRLETRLGVGTR